MAGRFHSEAVSREFPTMAHGTPMCSTAVLRYMQHPTTQPRPAAVGAKRGVAAEGGQTGPDVDRAAAVWTSFGPSPSGPRPGRRPALKSRGLKPRRYITNYMALKARQYGLKHSEVLGYAPGRRSSSSSNNQSPIKQEESRQSRTAEDKGQRSKKRRARGSSRRMRGTLGPAE